MSEPYYFSVLRFVPDPMRGEFVNLGIIVGNEETEEWHVELIDNRRRARNLDDSGSLGMVLSRINEIESQIDDYLDSIDDLVSPSLDIDANWLEELHTSYQNQLQVSSPQPVFVEELPEAIEVLDEEFLVDPGTSSGRSKTATKRTGKARLRKAFKDHGLEKNSHYFEHPSIETGDFEGVFDFVVANGEAVQASQVWSFQVAGQERIANQIKSWAWIVSQLQKQGAVARSNDRAIEVPADIDVHLISIPPENGSSSEAYREARSATGELGIEMTNIERVDVVADSAREKIASYGSELI